MKKRSGFTLIELIVTIAVIAMIAMMAAPSFGNMIKNQHFKANANDLVKKIKQARTYAVLNHQEVTLNLNNAELDSAPTFNWIPRDSAYLNISNNKLIFDKTGVLLSTFNTIEVCKDIQSRESIKITLTKLGYIEKVEQGNCT